jgi:Rer1 family protein
MVYWCVHLFLPGDDDDDDALPANYHIRSRLTILLVAYTLGIYLLNLFLAFLQPKFDPSLTQDEGLEDGDAGTSLPTKQDDEFRPFIRRLPEFKFWHSATRAIFIAFVCTWFQVFDIPVFWPVLVVYWFILFFLTSKSRKRVPPVFTEQS